MITKERSLTGVRRLLQHPDTLFTIVLLVCCYYSAVRFSVVLDDAFIYFRVVGNFMDTGFPVFNSGEKYFIVTSPLWLTILTVAKFLFSAADLEVLAKLISCALLAVASLFVYRILSSSIQRWAVLSPCFFFLSPVIGSLMGNEIALLYAAMFGLVWSFRNDKPSLAGFFLGVGYLARGEFVLIIIPMVLQWLLSSKNRHNRFVEGTRFFFKVILAAMPILLLWHIYYWIEFQRLLPETFQVKMAQGASGHWPLFHERLWEGILWILNHHMFLLVFVIVGAVRAWRTFGLLVGYLLLHTLLYIVLRIPFYHWYYYDYFIAIPLLMLVGIIECIRLVVRYLEVGARSSYGVLQLLRTISYPALIIGIIWFFQVQLQLFLPKYFSNIYSNNELDERYNTYRKLGELLRSDLRKGDVILAEEIGILSYYLRYFEVRDVVGIATNDTPPSSMYRWEYFVDAYTPRYIIAIRLPSRDRRVYEYKGKRYTYQLRKVTNPRAKYFSGAVFERTE